MPAGRRGSSPSVSMTWTPPLAPRPRNERSESGGAAYSSRRKNRESAADIHVKTKTRRNNNNRSFFERFIRTVHPFFFVFCLSVLAFERVSFLPYKGTGRFPAGVLIQRKEATFCQQREYFLVYDPASPKFSRLI